MEHSAELTAVRRRCAPRWAAAARWARLPGATQVGVAPERGLAAGGLSASARTAVTYVVKHIGPEKSNKLQ